MHLTNTLPFSPQAAFTLVFSFQVGVITSYWDTQVQTLCSVLGWLRECCSGPTLDVLCGSSGPGLAAGVGSRFTS